jgi:hypothetical protein
VFYLRPATLTDLPALLLAARHLDSVNLPNDEQRLAEAIGHAHRSFAGEVPAAARELLFVMVERQPGGEERVVGSSMIFAQHGTRRAPHIFFDVIDDERYSETLDRHFHHKILRLGYNYDGLTEIGGLVLLPEFRGHPEQLGKALVNVRFLYIAPSPRAVPGRHGVRAYAPRWRPTAPACCGRRWAGTSPAVVPGGRSPVPAEQGVHPHVVPAGSHLGQLAAAGGASTDRGGGPQQQGGGEGPGAGGLPLRPADRPLRRRSPLSRPHRRARAGEGRPADPDSRSAGGRGGSGPGAGGGGPPRIAALSGHAGLVQIRPDGVLLPPAAAELLAVGPGAIVGLLPL